MPKGWKWVVLGEAFNLQMGKTPSRSNPAYWTNGTEKWVSIADLKGQKFITTTKELITKEAVDESGIKVVPKGNVIFSFKLSLGKVSITGEDIYTNEAIMALLNNGSVDVDTEYLYYILNYMDWNNVGNIAAKGKTLNKDLISKLSIPIPVTLKEQLRIALSIRQQLELVDKARKAAQEQLETINAMPAVILKQAFKGIVLKEQRNYAKDNTKTN